MKIDKWKHIAITFAVMAVINPICNIIFGIIGTLYASAFMLALIVGKEFKDKLLVGTGFNKWDIAVSVGAWFLYTVFWLIYYDVTHPL